MEAVEKTKFIDKVAKALRDAAVELEEFQVKADLGMAEAQDKYEDVKREFNTFMQDSKYKIKVGKEKLDDLHTKFDELRVQLALGKANTLDAFREQKKELLRTLHELEMQLRTNEKLNHMYAVLLVEIEKFKAMLVVLEDKFEHGKTQASSSFEKGKQDFNAFVDRMKTKYGNEPEESQWEHFQSEVSEAFTHFKEAFKKP